MIEINTLIIILLIILTYIFLALRCVPKFRKTIKVYLYILVFIGLLFPEFKGIGEIKVNFGAYALVVAGIEIFEMIFKLIVENRIARGAEVSERMKKIYKSM